MSDKLIIGAADPNKAVVDKKDAQFVDVQAGILYRQTRAPEGNTWQIVERGVKTYIDASAGSTAVWGSITGNITDQTDLKNALNNKQDKFSGTIDQYVRGNGSLAAFQPAVIGSVLDSFISGPDEPVNNTDTVISSIQKLDARITSVADSALHFTTGVAGQIAFFQDANTITSSLNNVWDDITSTQTITGTHKIVGFGSNDLVKYYYSDGVYNLYKMDYNGVVTGNAAGFDYIFNNKGLALGFSSPSLYTFTLKIKEGSGGGLGYYDTSGQLTWSMYSNNLTMYDPSNSNRFVEIYQFNGTGIDAQWDTVTFYLEAYTNGTTLHSNSDIYIYTNSYQNKFATDGSVTMQGYAGTGTRALAVDSTGKLVIDTSSYITGSATLNQVAVGTGTNTIGSSANFTWDGSTFGITGKQTITGSITAATAFARGLSLTNTLVASANNDILSQVFINPTFTNGAFTGVTNFALRILAGLSYFGGAAYITGGSAITTAQSTALAANLVVSGATDAKVVLVANSPANISSYIQIMRTPTSTTFGIIGYSANDLTISNSVPNVNTVVSNSATHTSPSTQGAFLATAINIVPTGVASIGIYGDGSMRYRGLVSGIPFVMSPTAQTYTGYSVIGGTTQSNQAQLNVIAVGGLTLKYAFDNRITGSSVASSSTGGNGGIYNLVTLDNVSNLNSTALAEGIYNEVTLTVTHQKPVTVVYLNRSKLTSLSSALITTGYGHKIEMSGVTATTIYGVHIDIQGTIGKIYGIYQTNTGGFNMFGGKTKHGTLANDPTSFIDIEGLGYNQLRLRTSFTPTSSADTNGQVGDHAWDNNYFYWRAATRWERAVKDPTVW